MRIGLTVGWISVVLHLIHIPVIMLEISKLDFIWWLLLIGLYVFELVFNVYATFVYL